MTDLSPSNDASVAEIARAGHWPRWLTRRRLLFAGAATVMGGGMALNWGWLTAIGLAPILVSLAPCAVMCGLGLCMKGGSGGKCSDVGSANPDQTEGREN
ncbi:hypothetical protein [Roseovarius pelagicus]|uniref:DUF2892 domain-containing protein n=1 Tax=Roseovarius pelagicus TaxID=2980108 RepID=A0ABY6DIN9_9RHOB|nr:hypothetical protein [Roseovarius pelagicus]UXX85365.1 hypothetical protein N7U68_20340 [Roseovarius pelagicus]